MPKPARSNRQRAKPRYTIREGTARTPGGFGGLAPQEYSKHGFTLFEVLAALGLSAMVMMMVASALQLHLRMTDTRRDNVENAQLARAILRHFTNDLRAAVYVDAETIEAAQVATDSSLDDEAAGVGDGETGSAALSDDAAATGQIDPSTLAVPGLYGDLEQIQFDISRTTDAWATAPTDDTAVVAADLAPKPRGSLQTVAYYLNAAQTSTATPSYPAVSSTGQSTTAGAATDGGGLFRQVVDQPIASWAIESGGQADLGFYAELLAPEVISITFRYFDGTQWVESWDSYQQGGLPVAIEVTIVLTSTQDDTDETISTQLGYLDTSDSVYTTIVHLPTSLPTDETEALF